MARTFCAVFSLLWLAVLLVRAAPAVEQEGGAGSARSPHPETLFKPGTTCLACHNGLTSAAGEDVSIGSDWRGSIMANSSRDPYWQASVRREMLDHPRAAAEIEDECAICHMPMARAQANARGRKLSIFAHLPVSRRTAPDDLLAHDGVSCTMCHQISAKSLGTPESFTGGFVLDAAPGATPPPVFGPFQVDKGRTTVMRSASGFTPTEGSHVRQSELCATCHTLFTTALDRDGKPAGRLPEQVPYLEWRHSAYPAEQQTCQTCHMPLVRGEAAITSVLGTPRQGLARHVFRGGNFFMLRLLDRYRTELGVAASSQELAASTRWTVDQLQNETAGLSIEAAPAAKDRIDVEVTVRNRAGHKLPSGYPARRAWLELTVRDGRGQSIFHSGGLTPSGAIEGNDNDSDPLRYEPHYTEIRAAGEVQIYESAMVDPAGALTTGLLRGVRFIKDNRLLPRGFDKATAGPDIAVTGGAAEDADFVGGSDRVRYSIPTSGAPGPFTVDAKLHFQPIGFRWARNLAAYDATETRRFVSYYDAMADGASQVLAQAQIRLGSAGFGGVRQGSRFDRVLLGSTGFRFDGVRVEPEPPTRTSRTKTQ